MKNLILLSLIFFLVFIFNNCKNETVEEAVIIEEEVIQENTLLNPEKVDTNIPIPVAELKKAFFAWEGKEVTVIAYCDIMFSYGSVKDEVKLVSNPDSSTQLVYCELLEDYEGEKVEQSKTIVVKGTIDGSSFGSITLKDCEIVSIDGEIKENSNLNPENIGTEPIFVQDLHNSYFAWNNKEVSVIGYYSSTTTSTTSYGVTIRVDLADPETKDKAVGCRMLEEPPESIANNRNDIVIKGIIKGEVFGNVIMEECEIVK